MGEFVELLAPAGNYDAFLGALHAGADAVYLGGERFSARAYADNFDTAQIVRALHVAHFYGKKIYLTVNTLLKERELAGLAGYLAPFYEAGLDGVIVQDLGVLRYIRERFPQLSLHASTQMTVTGTRGAALLKEQGAVRIVPARELSLEEVAFLKKETGVEVECFVHGAMCYSYSGQCLFSSILGGRSGNRGRCAQPCRLPYGICEGKTPLIKECYPLSMKDLCTLEHLPMLMKAGIDSFKIEGRMKRPEYAAGVTAIYRKYMDLYRKEGEAACQVDPADLDNLRSLYIRSELQSGYYRRHNGREMIALENPGYTGCDEQLLAEIRGKYIHEPERMLVRLQVAVRVGEPIRLRLSPVLGEKTALPGETELSQTLNIGGKGIDINPVEVVGEIVQPARKAPLSEADIRKQMTRTGDSLLSVAACEICIEGDGFVPVRALNLLRREGVAAFEKAVIERTGVEWQKKDNTDINRPSQSITETLQIQDFVSDRQWVNTAAEEMVKQPARDCLVTTLEQFSAVVDRGCRRIYLESDLFLREKEGVLSIMEKHKEAYYLALPYILRKRDEPYLARLRDSLAELGEPFVGFLVRNLEGLSYAKEFSQDGTKRYATVSDAGLYCFNGEAAAFLSAFVQEITLPYELHAKEAAHLAEAARAQGLSASMIVYSRIPMMVAANCLKKTAGQCQQGQGKKGQLFLRDRLKAVFPVEINCEHCYNVIYNAVPYSLHMAKKERDGIGAMAFRYDFATESGRECQRILAGDYPFADYTTGHCKRGVE